MEYRKLGKTDISVSVLALGCWAFAGGPYWGEQDEQDSIDTVRAALDMGVNFFDTAEGYGDGYSELVLGKALKGQRESAIIATKVGPANLAYEDVLRACEASLERLQTDYIDLYQIHWPNRSVAMEETIRALNELQEQGKIRAIGVSNFGVGDLSDILPLGPIESDQLPYSLLWRAIEYGIQEKCLANNVSILCYSPLAQGLLTGKYRSPADVPEGRARTRFFSCDEQPGARHTEPGHVEEVFAALGRIREIADGLLQPMGNVAMAWLLTRPGVTSILAGARNPTQMKMNVQSVDLQLSEDVVRRLTEITEGLKQALGPNPDMWQSGESSRYR